jgi:hypothetical protein
LLLIPNAHDVIAQQFLLVRVLVEKCASNIARVDDALGPSLVIENWSTPKGTDVQVRPDLLHGLIDAARNNGTGHYGACMRVAGFGSCTGEKSDDISPRHHAYCGTVPIAHYDEWRIGIRQNPGGLRHQRLLTQHRQPFSRGVKDVPD